ncbi:MAG: hypothetical protein ACXV3F_06190, partial [Frankiaceae bacterium]
MPSLRTPEWRRAAEPNLSCAAIRLREGRAPGRLPRDQRWIPARGAGGGRVMAEQVYATLHTSAGDIEVRL